MITFFFQFLVSAVDLMKEEKADRDEVIDGLKDKVIVFYHKLHDDCMDNIMANAYKAFLVSLCFNYYFVFKVIILMKILVLTNETRQNEC